MSNCLSALTKTRLRVVVVIATCLTLVGLGSALFPLRSGAQVQQAQERVAGKRKRAPFVRGEVLVRYRSEALARNKTGITTVAMSDGRAVRVTVERFEGSDLVQGLRLARVPAGDTLKAVAALRRQPDVLYAEPNYILRATVTTPNDPNFVTQQQYGLLRIDAPTAWDTNTGSTGVVVAVLDQGINTTHEDLAANIWTNPQPGSVSGISGDLHGYNFVDNSGTVFSGEPFEDHASHVGGIVGAAGNNSKGVAGVNWSVGLMSLKFLSEDGFGETVDAIRALDYATQMRQLWLTAPAGTKGANIRVVNGSFGGAPFSNAFFDAVVALNNAGILFVTAAGNVDDGTRDRDNDLIPHYPSSFNVPNVISVNATDSLDQMPAFSHFGATSVDLGAPGVGILSSVPAPTLYEAFDGTSMSVGFVSGAAALLWAQNPNLTVAQVKNLLLLNGDIQASLVGKTLTGRRLNVARSFTSLTDLATDNQAPGTAGGFNITSQTGRSINLGWTATGDNGALGEASLYRVDFTDGSSGTVIPLKGVMPSPSGSPQTTNVRIPFRHTGGTLSLRAIDNVGNEGPAATVPVSVPLAAGDPYVPTVGSAVALTSGGDRLNINGADLNGDDVYADFLLPCGFSFPFFGEHFTEVIISSNGALYFSEPPVRADGNADDAVSSPRKLGGYKIIAGLWDDLDLRTSRRGDAGVYISRPTANRLIFRWQGVPCQFDPDLGICTGTTQINFEIELNTDGTIKTRYGSGNTGLLPTVGIGGGEPDGYEIASHSSEQVEKNLTNAAEVTFTPRASTPPPPATLIQLVLEEGGPTPTEAAAFDALLHLRDLFPVINNENLLNEGFDQNTRVVVFATNLQLCPGESASDVVVNLVDNNGKPHNIGAEDVRAMGSLGFSQVIFRLPTDLAAGTCTVKVTAHSQTTNAGTIRIK